MVFEGEFFFLFVLLFIIEYFLRSAVRVTKSRLRSKVYKQQISAHYYGELSKSGLNFKRIM